MGLRDVRREKGLTQEEAARLLGVTRRTYVNYEAGKIKESSVKYKFVLETLDKSNQIDEAHGILTFERIKEVCNKVLASYACVECCYLFGSYAKGKANEKSDVDLLVAMPIDGMKFFELAEILREKLKKRVDLVDISQLEGNFPLTKEILIDGVKIYG